MGGILWAVIQLVMIGGERDWQDRSSAQPAMQVVNTGSPTKIETDHERNG